MLIYIESTVGGCNFSYVSLQSRITKCRRQGLLTAHNLRENEGRHHPSWQQNNRNVFALLRCRPSPVVWYQQFNPAAKWNLRSSMPEGDGTWQTPVFVYYFIVIIVYLLIQVCTYMQKNVNIRQTADRKWLLMSNTVVIIKSSSLRCNYETKHRAFSEQTFPHQTNKSERTDHLHHTTFVAFMRFEHLVLAVILAQHFLRRDSVFDLWFSHDLVISSNCLI